MNDSRGSLWNKWDLHVHTPYSIDHQYIDAGGEDARWEKFISNLEALPPEFKAIGINDYIFIDGYKRVIEYKEKGRLQNIDIILPVIELRLNKFGGSNKHFSRINYHIIFSDKITPDVIEHQFLSALSAKYELSPIVQEISWKGVPTKQSLEEFGRKIKLSVPKEHLPHFDSDLKEGFNNLNLDLNKVQEVLSSSFFKDKYLTAVGKTEWADIKWNDHSIADKKTIINGSDFVFISSPDAQHFTNAKTKLTSERVNDLLLDCSDAHYFSDSSEKDRIGNCHTWLKCDTTFEGLKQIKNEPESRIFIGDVPPKMELVRKNPSKYIKSISVHKTVESSSDGWFDTDIPFNSDLVAIIGNKGNGKSALADIIGLLGGTKNYNEFSFLVKEKFRKRGLADSFTGELTWQSNTPHSKLLSKDPEEHETERVKYLPQQFLEKLCNEDEERFEHELKDVIFSHVNDADRLKQSSLDDLIALKTKTKKEAIEILLDEVKTINETLVGFENLSSSSNRKKVEAKIKDREEEHKTHLETKPTEVTKVDNNPEAQQKIEAVSKELESLNKGLSQLKEDIKTKEAEQKDVKTKIAATEQLAGTLENFQKQYDQFLSNCADEAKILGIDIKDIVFLDIKNEKIASLKQTYKSQNEKLNNLLENESDENLNQKKQRLDKKILELQGKLDEPNRKYQVYLKELSEWEAKELSIGAKLTEEMKNKEYIKKALSEDIASLKQERLNKARDIHQNIKGIAQIYEELYKPVQVFILRHNVSDDQFKLNFEVSIVNKTFVDKFFDFISQNVKGKFQGKDDGRKYLKEVIDATDFNDTDSAMVFLETILSSLAEKEQQEPESLATMTQLRKNIDILDLYSFLFSFSYIQPTYSLKLGNKELSKLSPGEKGALLLIFYLLVDNDEIPLIIDQPEENLDNQTVYNLLVPCIKEAKDRRQIIIVTHNPNLAVVCDAEQIICASMNKVKNNEITYKSGSIENPEINAKIIDILEGTTPAFKKRDSKYFIESV